MNIQQAKDAAQQWVLEEGTKLPGFFAAFLHGSVNDLPDSALVPPASDIDVMVVCGGDPPEQKLGKFFYQNVLLEVSFLPRDRVQSPEQVLSDYHLAGSFRKSGILLDPTGELTRIQAAVSQEFARPEWIRRRCEHARQNALNFLGGVNPGRPLHDQVMAWLFANGVLTHILLVAGMRNPTVRKRYAAVRELLEEQDRLDLYAQLLELLGCAAMTRQRAEEHLTVLAGAFDAAASVIKTPYPFAADLTPAARPVAIDGSRELIARGLHREAVFWITATYSRCQWVLSHDASPAMQERHTAGYHRLLNDLGIASMEDLPLRGEQVRAFIPTVWEVAQRIFVETVH